MIWVAIVCCLLVSIVFSGIEAGILSVNRVRLKHRLKHRDRAAIKLDRLLRHPDRLLVTVLVVTNLANIFAMTLITQKMAEWMGPAGYLVALAGFFPIYLLGLELLPKSIFRRFPYRALAALAGPLRLANSLLAPLHWVGKAVSRVLTADLSGEKQKLFLAREEFKYLTIEGERTGTLSQVERQMIHNVVDFRAVTANEVMIPIQDVCTIGSEASVGELLALGREKRIDRWPVMNASGEFVGLVTVFDVVLGGRERGRIEPYQRRIVKVAPTEHAYGVLRKLRAARSTLAAVVGPHSKPMGVVTWEALIKRLVHTAT